MQLSQKSVELRVHIHSAMEAMDAAEWNALVADGNPLLRHEFLQAMERHHCVGRRFGWLPRHIAVYEGERLVGAMPLYEKHNSYGEFVFDHAWADAYQRAGMAYYPKLVSAVPYTPAVGPRLLSLPELRESVLPLLLDTALRLTGTSGCSGLHCLFPEQDEQAFLQRRGLLMRHDCQYHWHNRDYRDFAHFLQGLTSKKRKNIRRERRRVAESGVHIRRLDGHSANDRDWDDFTRFYNQTFSEKWGIATFNRGFFTEVAERMPDRVLLVLADLEGECIAGALMYRSDLVLYGRHWGATRQLDCLHFELCYYQGIDYCIEQGLQRFEPGAQGEHKMPRGFEPSLTRSGHWLTEPGFRGPVAQFVEHERQTVLEYMAELRSASPYRSEGEEGS